MTLEEFEQLIDLMNMKISNAIKDAISTLDDIDHLDEAELEAKVKQQLVGETNGQDNQG